MGTGFNIRCKNCGSQDSIYFGKGFTSEAFLYFDKKTGNYQNIFRDYIDKNEENFENKKVYEDRKMILIKAGGFEKYLDKFRCKTCNEIGFEVGKTIIKWD